jgi:hypothetical protein
MVNRWSEGSAIVLFILVLAPVAAALEAAPVRLIEHEKEWRHTYYFGPSRIHRKRDEGEKAFRMADCTDK